MGRLGTGDMSVVNSSLSDVLCLVDFFTSRSYHVGYVFTQVLNTQPMLAELGLREDE